MHTKRKVFIPVFVTVLSMIGFTTSCSAVSNLWDSSFSSSGGVYKIGTPYEVSGKWYYPKEDYGYEETGIASWYGPDFHNGITANGEVYDMHAMTAAHRTLPLPSIVRVTNLENGKSVILRVNDRGPFVSNRIIDVSKLAAERLGFHEQGTTHVKVEIMAEESQALKYAMLGGDADAKNSYKSNTKTTQVNLEDDFDIVEASSETNEISFVSAQESEAKPYTSSIRSITKPPAKPVVKQEPLTTQAVKKVTAPTEKTVVKETLKSVEVAKTNGLFVQVGAFSSQENAKGFASELASYGNTVISPTTINGKDVYRVRLGPYSSGKEALAILDKMRKTGYKDSRILEEKVVKETVSVQTDL